MIQLLFAMFLPFALAASFVAPSVQEMKPQEMKSPGMQMTPPPAVGQTAPDFTLSTLEGKRVRLSEVTAKMPVTLVVLRGYPGYQCPLCNIQVQDFIKKADTLTANGARVLLVYPGPGDNLKMRAQEFLVNKPMPANFDLLLDPDYSFTNQYGLRWDAPKETAYPSTFLIEQGGKVVFAKISKTHGGRTTAAEIQEAWQKHKM